MPTAAQNEPITDHGKTVYITHDQKVLRDELELFGFVGIPSVLVCGLLLHFLAGVQVFSETSTLSERHRAEIIRERLAHKKFLEQLILVSRRSDHGLFHGSSFVEKAKVKP